MTPVGTRLVLVVGYGNPLCGDDGVGPAIVDRLRLDPRFEGVQRRVQHQLTPELARDIAASSLVVLVDAATGRAAGEIVVERVDHRAAAASASSHRVDPAGLAALAADLFGRTPPVFTVSVGTASMEVGDGLSPIVAAAIPAAADAVAAIVEGHGRA